MENVLFGTNSFLVDHSKFMQQLTLIISNICWKLFNSKVNYWVQKQYTDVINTRKPKSKGNDASNWKKVWSIPAISANATSLSDIFAQL